MEVQINADDEEIIEISHCHKPSIKLLESFIENLDNLGTVRALEIAAGDGQVSRDLLRKFFE